MEFFTQIINWVQAHYGAVITFLSTSGLASALGALIMVFKNRKVTKENTIATNKLSEIISNSKDISKTVNAIESEEEKLKEQHENIIDGENCLTMKVNAILEIMSIVYGYSVRDEKVRNAISAVFENAKYNETATRADLLKKIEELEKASKEEAKKVEKTAKAIKKTLAVNEDANTILRG